MNLSNRFKSFNFIQHPLLVISWRLICLYGNDEFYNLPPGIFAVELGRKIKKSSLDKIIKLTDENLSRIKNFIKDHEHNKKSSLFLDLTGYEYILKLYSISPKEFIIEFLDQNELFAVAGHHFLGGKIISEFDLDYDIDKSIELKCFFKLFDLFDDPVHVTDSNYKIVYMNNAMKELFGQGDGRCCYELITKFDKPCFGCKMNLITRGKYIRYNIELDDAEGKKYYDVINTPYLFRDGSTYKLSIMRDITDVTEKQHIINFISNSVENSASLISICEEQGKIIYSNKAQAELFNMSKEELTGKNIFKLLGINPLDKENMEVLSRVIDIKGEGKALPVLVTICRINDEFHAGPLLMSIAFDISEMENLNIPSDREKGYFKRIIDYSKDSFFLIDREAGIIDYNRAFINEFNVDDTSAEALKLTELVFGKSKSTLSKKIKSVFKKKMPETAEISLSRGGDVKHYLVSLNLLQSNNPDDERIYGFVKDITQIKTLQQMLEDEKYYNRSIIENVNLGFVLVSDDNRYLDYNQAYLEILGRDEEELEGKTFYDFTVSVYKEDQEKIMEEMRKTNEPIIFEKEYKRKDGARIPILVTMSRLKDRDGRDIGTFAFIKDISEQKNIERELTEKNIRFLNLINMYNHISADFLNCEKNDDVFSELHNSINYIVNPDSVEILKGGFGGFKSVFSNNPITRSENVILNSRLSTIIDKLLKEKKAIFFLKDIKAELNDEDLSHFPGLINYGSSIFLPIILKNELGGIIILSFREKISQLDDILLNILIGISNLAFITIEKINSINEQKKIQIALDRYERLTAMGRIIAGVAHEINNPLSIMQFDLDELKAAIAGGGISESSSEDDIEELLNSIQEEITRMSGILYQLKDYSKPESPEEGTVCIDDVLKSYPIKILIKNIEKKGIQISTSLNTGKSLINISRNRLIQVLMNIIHNADEAIEDKKEGKLHFETNRIERNNEPYITISIKDNGVGISSDNIHRIFEPFFTTKKSEGTGLGLPLSYSIIKSCNGDIEVESEFGKGADFRIFFPEKKKV